MKKRMVSGFLAILMVLNLAGILTDDAMALDVKNITDISDLNGLSCGFNLLGDQELNALTLANNQVLSKLNVIARRTKSSSNTYTARYINNMDSAMANLSSNFNSAVEEQTKFKILSLGVKAKLGLQGSSSYSDSANIEYYTMEASKIVSLQYMDLYTPKSILSLWNEDALRDEFKESIANIKTDKDIEQFFTLYGTHLLTRFTSGGEVSVTYKREFLSHALASSLTMDANVSTELQMSRFNTITQALDTAVSDSQKSSNSSERIETYAYGKGGEVGIVASLNSSETTVTRIETYLDSINEANSDILIDDQLQLLPIWELLVREEDASLRSRLESYYNDHISQQNADFYSQYIYHPVSSVDYSDYTFINSVQDMNGIRENLNGKYVLLSNLDLSEEGNWTPIGTRERPFTGIFDGNGNTISGLSVTELTDNAAGLFGYNSGLIKNLEISGNIEIDCRDSENNLSYLGGIAGYNQGRIDGCINHVSVNGETEITQPQTISAEETWFDEHASEISEAISISATAAENNAIYDTFPLKLTGKAENVTIRIPDRSSIAFLVLENADISGTIASIGDNARALCIVTTGISNSWVAPVDAIAVNAMNADIYITGDAPLSITGGQGHDGGTDEVGADGQPSISCQTITLSCSEPIQFSGGNGGKGGIGKKGSNGTSSVNPTNGTAGNPGRKGGTGAKSFKENSLFRLELFNGTCYLVSGNGGDGGAGGDGGNGGKNTWPLWVDTTSGGNGGAGGSGGDTLFQLIDISFSAYNGKIVSLSGLPGNSGHGGAGGKEGDHAGDVSHHGTNGKGGASGSIGKRLDSSGNTTTIVASISNGNRLYSDYYDPMTQMSWSTAQEVVDSIPYSSGTDTDTSQEKVQLVSIGSLAEQKTIEELLSSSTGPSQKLYKLYKEDESQWNGDSCWIGLKRSSRGFNIFEWEDGSAIRVEDDSYGPSAHTSLIDGNNTPMCAAYANWADGEPDYGGHSSDYVCLNAQGYEWSDTAQTCFRYITETILQTPQGNALTENAMLSGGICGLNDRSGQINLCINDASITSRATATDAGVSAYAGGISGCNLGKISGSLNQGIPNAFALSQSMLFSSDAWAANISSGSGITNCLGTANTNAIAISANSLSNNHPEIEQKELYGEDPSTELEQLWENHPMQIEAVTGKEVFVNSTFDPSSITVTIDGVRQSSFTYNYYFGRIGSAAEVAVSCLGYTRTFPQRVVSVQPVSIQTADVPLEYYLGDIFSPYAQSFLLEYNDGSTKVIRGTDSLIELSTPDMRTVGSKTVLATYNGSLSVSYTIQVRAPEMSELELYSLPDKLSYLPGEELDTAGLRLRVTFSNGAVETISSGYSISGFSSAEAGVKTIFVSYGGKSVSFQVTVSNPEQIDETAPQISVERKTARAGETVTLAVQLKNNPGIIAAYLSLHYDVNQLELIEVQDAQLLNDASFGRDLQAVPFSMNWDDSLAISDNTKSGTIALLTFKVLDACPEGNAAVEISSKTGEIYNFDMEDISFAMIGGGIDVIDFIPGDVNSDLAVNGKDVTVLRRYLAHWDGVSIFEAASNVNGDDQVNGKDVTILRRYLARWEGVELLSSIPRSPTGGLSVSLMESPSQGTFVISSASGAVGEAVTVDVSIEDNPGIIAAYLNLYYDTDRLRLLSVEDTGLLLDSSFGNNYGNLPFALCWDDSLSQDNNSSNGCIAHLTFQILSEGAASVWIEFTSDSIYDTEMENVGFQETAGTIICGPVTPEFYTEVLPGLQQFDFSISVPYLEMNDSSLVNIYAALYNGAQLIAYDCIQDSAINLVQQEVNLHIPYPEDGSDWIWKVFVLDAHMKPLVPSDSGNIRKIES